MAPPAPTTIISRRTCRLAGSNGVCVALAKAVVAGVDDGRGRQARVMVAIARDVPRCCTESDGRVRGPAGRVRSVVVSGFLLLLFPRTYGNSRARAFFVH